MTEFVWNLFKDKAIDKVSNILGKGFQRLLSSFDNNDKENFTYILEIILETNAKIKQDLENLKNGTYITQNHSGNGNNIGGSQTINNYNQYKNEVDLKKEPLYINSLFLYDIKMRNELLDENYYHNVDKLLKGIIDISYKESIKELLPNNFNRLMKAINENDNDNDRCKSDRQMIIDNKGKIQKLLLQYLKNH